MSHAHTLLDKLWDAHVVERIEDGPNILYADLHLIHEVSSSFAFRMLDDHGVGVRRPDLSVATMDHSIPTDRRALPLADALADAQVRKLSDNCAKHGISLFDLTSEDQGIVHVFAPEFGLIQPGMTVLCGDSHTGTHGAFGALAFGIGSSELALVLATQCVPQHKPGSFEIRVDGELASGVTSKDLMLALLGHMGIDAGTGLAFEYRGRCIESLSMEARMTLCNMSIEGGSKTGLIAPDDTTFEYLEGRRYAPTGRAWDEALERWRALRTDEGAVHHRQLVFDGSQVEPMITYGTDPGMSAAVTGVVPDPASLADPHAAGRLERALEYMDMRPGQELLGRSVDVVFVGSCTNSRLSDLRQVADVLRDRKVASGVRMLVVPGSTQVRRAAEAEGLDRVFVDAGAEWRQAGCSMCVGMNPDRLGDGEVAVSTTNRNFEGRQGRGGRTMLASPLTAAASAVAGSVADPRVVLEVV